MKEEILKNYINKLEKKDIISYLSRECIEASDTEIDTIYNLIKCNYDEIINGNFMSFISNYQDVFNKELYLKIIEKYNNYKSLLE